MNELLLLVGVCFSMVYFVFGFTAACIAIANGIKTPKKYYYEDNYNWFGSYCIFIISILVALPFYILIKLIMFIYKITNWLFTVGRNSNG